MNVIFSIIAEKNIKSIPILLDIWVYFVTFASIKRKVTGMIRLKTIIGAIASSQILKYALVVVVGVALVGFVGDNSILSHFQNKVTISELEAEIAKYRSSYEADRQRMERLDRDPRAIEEIAREKYFMKREDEDIFVFNEDNAEMETIDNEGTE